MVRNYLVVILVILGPVLALTTVLLFGVFEGPSRPQLLRFVVLSDIVYILLIATLIARRILRMIAARRNRSAGSQLHLRLTGVFSFIALVPTVLVAIFATITLQFGLEGWFSTRVQQVVSNSLLAAEAYESEHRITLTNDARTLADFIERQRGRYRIVGAGEMRDALSRGQGIMQRSLSEAYVINGSSEIVARGERSYLFDFEPPSMDQINRALAGEIVVIEDWPNSEFRALIALENYLDRLLYVTRDVDGNILNLLDETQETVKLYQQLESDRGKLLFEFALIYLGFAFVVILAAIWLGLWFADKLSRPMGRLASAAQRVSDGDLDVKVREEAGDDEIALLGRVFNRMITQVKGQRDTLIANNAETELRRRLFDSVLSGVTAGVIGLDKSGKIDIANAAAMELLTQVAPGMIGAKLQDAIPEFAPLFDRLKRRSDKVARAEIQLSRAGKEEKLLVRIATRQSDGGEIEGYVVTFDDVTDLVSAQRMAAWSDVARRIAHEIKNPLTPIQLSAERLKRKFGPMVPENDRETLEQLSNVIIRQTNDLRRIVDEFSKFARMPAAQRKNIDIIDLIKGAVLLQKSGRPDISFEMDLPDTKIMAFIDGTMMNQALTNLVKNATEAIDARAAETGEAENGVVKIIVEPTKGEIIIRIQDNGIGLPADRLRLFEPYVTLRDSGTGLGLSIVKKIIEEHDASLELLDAPRFKGCDHTGAEARIILAIADANFERQGNAK
ncbi:MAG: PAS domain-containing sensor histidine kinase [Rhodobacteraceae bacterium]|nr:PAS domain-containing sensor histidine kinase [Paracoccaceae bacterium]